MEDKENKMTRTSTYKQVMQKIYQQPEKVALAIVLFLLCTMTAVVCMTLQYNCIRMYFVYYQNYTSYISLRQRRKSILKMDF